MGYQCPACQKIWPSTMELARHMLGTGDQAHKTWINSKGLSFSNLLLMQTMESGNKGYVTLANLLEKEASKVE
jgi:hypothetical protein